MVVMVVTKEPWRYNSVYGTVIDISYCQFGLETDDRCDSLHCLFRTVKALAPDHPMEIGKIACPREREYEDNGSEISTVY